MTQHTDLLPATVREFLAAHIARDAGTASSFLTEDAVLVDQGETFHGREKTHAFLRDAGSEFEYTTEQIGARRVDDAHWVVTVRLEGTFPGGVAELDYRFALRDGLIAELVIANHTA
ncbi:MULTISPECIES: nuclear transport factor 2 family protein [unclassified Amycolatopsis]|uniref:nuclear transport factor 2 family protein n=1 Tax=unclassified Amycolatopsis TaxID=2618356 RepID=UPI0028743E6A|nr:MULTISPECIES: nuclear transport factor 2 family protein [unclassified Amycolatopsis]MDS0139271.1 nuclear transport factor 2 family protein [Amycolatopsis sp. 505]MDS0144503.1 nuclear transport factor 2 family protein [Amycolatopsis sp. CM201R]